MSSGRQRRIPRGVIQRLPQYLNALHHLSSEGHRSASSAMLSELTGVNSAEIRRDLAYFGSLGKPGVGYEIGRLSEHIQHVLGSDHIQRIAVVGAGNLGCAIAGHEGLLSRGFTISAIFDNSPARIGSMVGDLEVHDVKDLAEVVSAKNVNFGIIAVPSDSAQDIADRMCSAGIKVILNYSSSFVHVGEGVTLHNTDPIGDMLRTLYYLSRSGGVTVAS